MANKTKKTNEIDITKKSVLELKAMAFETRERMDALGNNLNVIRQELFQREQQTKKVVQETLKKKK